MPQPSRSFVDESGVAWLVLDNGARIQLPIPSGSGGGETPPSSGEVPAHGHPEYLTDAEADALFLTPAEADLAYVNAGGDVMTGPLTVPDLAITGGAAPGLVWTAEDMLGAGSWQEPSSLVVAETSDPVLINWYDQSTEGWEQYSGTGTLAFTELNSPSMPGVLDCTGDVWAEWRASEPMVFEPGALYRMTVRARLTASASLSFGFQGYDAATPASVVDTVNGSSSTLPHWCAVGLTAGDSSYVDPVKSGEWLAWTGYISGKADGVAEGVPTLVGTVAPAEAAVLVASGVSQWRPAFRATGGQAWIDAVEVHRLDRSLELPGGIRASDVYAQSVAATTVTTENLIVPPSTEGYVLTAVDNAGGSEWVYPPVTATEGPPPRSNLLTVNQESLETDLSGWTSVWQCTHSRVAGTMFGSWALRATNTTGTNMLVRTPYTLATGGIPATAGTTYTLSAQLNAVSAKAAVEIEWWDAAGARIGSGIVGNTLEVGQTGRCVVSGVAPAGTVCVSAGMYGSNVTAVGQIVEGDGFVLLEGASATPSEAPKNPLTVNIGTVAGRQGCFVSLVTTGTTITSTVPNARVPGSKAVQFALTVPAMVTGRATFYVNQSANSTSTIYGGIAVEDEAGTFLYPDDWAVASTSTYHGTTYFRAYTSGNSIIPAFALWKRHLPPGTYQMYPRSWLSGLDASSTKTLSIFSLDLEIDPSMTYLTGQR